jgi:hypothetical protein
MAKLKPKKKRTALGASPEETFAEKAASKRKELDEAITAKNCPVAFGRVLDVVSYASMARATSPSSMAKKHATTEAEAIRAYRAACQKEE